MGAVVALHWEGSPRLILTETVVQYDEFTSISVILVSETIFKALTTGPDEKVEVGISI